MEKLKDFLRSFPVPCFTISMLTCHTEIKRLLKQVILKPWCWNSKHTSQKTELFPTVRCICCNRHFVLFSFSTSIGRNDTHTTCVQASTTTNLNFIQHGMYRTHGTRIVKNYLIKNLWTFQTVFVHWATGNRCNLFFVFVSTWGMWHCRWQVLCSKHELSQVVTQHMLNHAKRQILAS